MSVRVRTNGSTVEVEVQKQRVDGDNDILEALKAGNFAGSGIEEVSINFESVEFINSLGVTEIVNIHRLFKDEVAQVRLIFRNVDKKVNAILELVEIQKIADIEVRT